MKKKPTQVMMNIQTFFFKASHTKDTLEEKFFDVITFYLRFTDKDFFQG